MVWWLSIAAQRLTGSDAALAVRLPFILLFALSTWLMFLLGDLVCRLRPGEGVSRANPLPLREGAGGGVAAAIAFNLSPVFGITTGTWVLPDGPLDCALLAAMLCLMRALAGDGRAAWGWWLGAGAAAGLALASKYSAVLTLGGVLVYLLTQPEHRRWLERAQPYAAAAMALAVFSPVLIWNATHHWASFAFQGERATAAGWQPFGPIVTLAGEALFVLPWIWAAAMLVLWRTLRLGPRFWQGWLLVCAALPPILLFIVISFWSRRVLFHWAAPGYLFLFPLLGVAAVEWRWAPRVARATSVLTLAVLLLVVADIQFAWVERVSGGTDPGLQARDWTPLADALRARGLLDRPDTVIAGLSWSDTGKIAYALAPAPVICLNSDCRQFGLNGTASAAIGQDVLLLGVRQTEAGVQAAYGDLFDHIERLPPIGLMLSGRPAVELPLFLGHRLRRLPTAS